MNRATLPTGWVRNPVMKLPDLNSILASSYELGWTWNPLTGCEYHTPEGLCKGGGFPCYAYKLAHTRLKERYLANKNISPLDNRGDLWVVTDDKNNDPFYPRFWNNRLLDGRDELCNAKPRGVFVCDMSDLFGVGIPEEWTRRVLGLIRMNPIHRFYLLTKQPQNLLPFSPFPENCWVGVTATNPQALWIALEKFKQIEAKIKYISFEPLLDSVFRDDWFPAQYTLKSLVDWVIIGAQTKPYKPPKIEWVEEIVRACDKAGIPVFLKDNLWSLFDGSRYPVPLWAFDKQSRLRQELPT